MRIEKTKVEVRNTFFNWLRSSAETDLMVEFGLRRSFASGRETAAIAMKNGAALLEESIVNRARKLTPNAPL